MENNSVIYMTVAFVIAEGVNVWACWLNPPYSGISDVPYSTLKKGEKAAFAFTVGYGLFATVVTRNLAPLLIALLFNGVMWFVYERAYAQDKGAKA